MYNTFVIELAEDVENDKLEKLGNTTNLKAIEVKGVKLDLDKLIKTWEEPLEKVFPTKGREITDKVQTIISDKKCAIIAKSNFAKPRVFIPAFPGTNCEEDTKKAFVDSGADARIEIFRNLKANDVQASIDAFAKQIEEAQIIAIPGGFSAGDEPDGSGKFIATVFRNPKLKELIHKHLY